MSDDFITVEIDGKPVQARKGQMLIEVTDANNTYVPRFCYHHKLSVAANCRMCLVEVEKAPKPLPACATPVMEGMKVSTRSQYALDAQKSVMEFLLINHPLDCPICDQGGECELQDLAMGYGSDVSRYQEKKRVVKDKDIGPLVQTDMTRCIHCTRCVRFGEEIAGIPELGCTGRGEHMQIGTYVEKSMVSEMSGNVIDLCPVGALTSKPFRFSARTWEMSQHDGIAAHDAIGSNIHFHVKNDRVKRVVPAENEMINEVWISDRDRFSYEGLYSDDRLTTPIIKKDGNWEEVEWETAFAFAATNLNKAIKNNGAEHAGVLTSPAATTEEHYLLQKLIRSLGSNNIDHRLRQCDFSDQDMAPVFPWLGQSIVDLESVNAALIIGGNPRKEQPLLNHRIRKAALNGADIMFINSIDHEMNFAVSEKNNVTAGKLVQSLSAIIKALSDSRQLDEDTYTLVQNSTVDDSHKRIAEKLLAAEKGSVLIGNFSVQHPQFSTIRYLAGIIADLADMNLGYLGEAANTSGAWLAGAIPHRTTGGEPLDRAGHSAQAMFANNLSAYILFNIEPELDCLDGGQAIAALKQAECVISVSPFITDKVREYADVVLPASIYAENEGTYVNIEGVKQEFAAVVSAQGEARPGWKIIRVLANTLGIDGFDYNSLADIKNEITPMLENITPANMNAWRCPESLPAVNGAIERITSIPANSVDPLVRRAPALQQTADIADARAHIGKDLAEKISVSDTDRIKLTQEDTSIELEVNIDSRIPENTVLVHGGIANESAAWPSFGEVSIQKV